MVEDHAIHEDKENKRSHRHDYDEPIEVDAGSTASECQPIPIKRDRARVKVHETTNLQAFARVGAKTTFVREEQPSDI